MAGCPSSVAIATKNPGKIRPARKALTLLCGIGDRLVAIEPPVGLKAQPVGSLEVFRGALKRALHAFEATGERGLGIGVEAGLIEFYTGTGYLEAQIAVVVGPGGRISTGLSMGFEIPPTYVERMKQGLELGEIYGKRRYVGDIGESIGYIGVETGGAITREDLTFQAVLAALLPWYKGETTGLLTLDRASWIINL